MISRNCNFMPSLSPDMLAKVLREQQFLEPGQLQWLGGQTSWQSSQAMIEALLQRGWLTAYQADKLLHGSPSDLTLGQYALLDVIGHGGMGQIFKARHRRLDRIVALKEIIPDRIGRAHVAERFQREGRAAARLCHPHVVTIHDADEINGRHFLVMEFIKDSRQN
jgi:serine/threonine protein kinase